MAVAGDRLPQMTSRKKTGVAFWAAVVGVMALVGYPLSFGPACWIASRNHEEHNSLLAAYRPLIWCELNGPAPLSRSIWWWTHLCAGSDWDWGHRHDGGFFWFHKDASSA